MSDHPFDQHYFHGGAKVGGYAGEGYRDFSVHRATFAEVMKRSPKSVLELGSARGYVLKRIEDVGIRVKGLEISEHCRLTRAVEPIVTWDVTRVPWPVEDKSFDLALSVAVLEHIPEDKLPGVFAELARTCKRGLHGIDVHDEDGFDKTHWSIFPLDWWRARMPAGHEAVDKEDLERAAPPLDPSTRKGVKLNLGSFTTMFDGWRNIDAIDLSAFARANGHAFTCWDLLRGLPYDDGVVDLIFASHVLEHFTYDAGARLLVECRRVLQPGGVLRVLVPDAALLMRKYTDGSLGDLDELSGTAAGHADQARKLYELLLSGHASIYDATALEGALRRAGFASTGRSQFRRSRSPVMTRETVDLYPDLSLIVEAW